MKKVNRTTLIIILMIVVMAGSALAVSNYLSTFNTVWNIRNRAEYMRNLSSRRRWK